MVNLFPHQAEIINNVREAFAYNNNVLMQSPTGSGKSVCASEIVKGANSKNKNVWFTVPRIELLMQMSTTFRDFGIKHSFISGQLQYFEPYKTHICTIETLRKRMAELRKPDFIIIDEAHFYGNGVADIVAFAREHNIKVLGLSATPARNDNTGMGDWFDVMVKGKSVRWLIDEGFLSDYILVQPKLKLDGTLTGNYIDLYKEHALGLKTIVFCKNVAHSIAVAKEFCLAGITAANIDGTMGQDQRRDIIRAFATNKIDVLTNNMLLTFGFDLALAAGIKDVTIDGMIDLASTQSLPMQMQKNGRVLRRKAFGKNAVIIDCAGNSHEKAHGLPCADRDWQLIKGNVRTRDLEVREQLIKAIHCKSCYRPSKFGKTHCPHCGSEFEFDYKKIKVIDGEMVVITPEMLKDEQAAKEMLQKKSRMEVGIAKTLDDLNKIAEARGYSKGWVYTMARVKNIKR